MSKVLSYTGAFDLIINDLEVGTIGIKRAIPAYDEEGNEIETAPDGSTLVVHPGDQIILADDSEFVHAFFDEVDEPLVAILTVADMKAILAELGVDIPKGAKKADLVKLLDENLPSTPAEIVGAETAVEDGLQTLTTADAVGEDNESTLDADDASDTTKES